MRLMVEVKGRSSETIAHALLYSEEENTIQGRTNLTFSKVMMAKRSLQDWSTDILAPCPVLFWGQHIATLLTDGEYSVQDRL